MKRYLIVHGHFYQPHRENPWTERIDRQESAAPYHDWNERITHECYRPNARSRRLDGAGRVMSIVNNYEHISFNFGTTLMSWIETFHPDLHRRILEADAASMRARGGHGNAIAQVYNHVIMPLANARDQYTQIRWGKADFRRRFGRETEGIWLGETAVNDQTLEILMDEGIRFIILSPHQADRVRPIGGGQWESVAGGSIRTGMAYRCFGSRRTRSRKRWIDIFFYDADLSTAVSFNHLLWSGDALADAVAGSFDRTGGDLVTIATDGEIYGHHEPFGDMALAYLMDGAARARGVSLTSFGAYLAAHEPEWEVQVKQGRAGEGTAWSCSHGVGRWKEDCGCNVGAPRGWNQKWRGPLRRGLNAVRDELAALYESTTAPFFEDPWKVRDEYVEILDGRSAGETARFIDSRARRPLSDDERRRAAALLESQRQAMLMFSSDGWFFNDISGIEPRQLMMNAARAIELAGEPAAKEIEGRLLEELRSARSNMPGFGTGADVYIDTVRRESAGPDLLAGRFAISRLLQCPRSCPESLSWNMTVEDERVREGEEGLVSAGIMSMASETILEERRYGFLCGYGPPAEAVCAVVGISGEGDEGKVFEAIDRLEGVGAAAVRAAARRMEWRTVTLGDLFYDDRQAIMDHIAEETVSSMEEVFDDIYHRIAHLLRACAEARVSIPDSLVSPARVFLSHRLSSELSSWDRSLDPSGLSGVVSVMEEAGGAGIHLNSSAVSETLGEVLVEKLSSLREGLDARVAAEAMELVESASRAGIAPPPYEVQNVIHDLLQGPGEEAMVRIEEKRGADEDRAALDSLLALARRLNFNTDVYESRLK